MELLQNPDSPNAQWVVQKFGGTSIGKFAAKIAEEVASVPAYIAEDKVVLVCSARSGSTKALGTTNLLLRAAEEALQPSSGQPAVRTRANSTSSIASVALNGHARTHGPIFNGPAFGLERVRSAQLTEITPAATPTHLPSDFASTPLFSGTLGTIYDEHVGAADEFVRDLVLRGELREQIFSACNELRAFLAATRLIGEISPRSKDIIVAFGERLACQLVAAGCAEGSENIVPASDNEWDGGPIQLNQSFYDSVAAAVGERLAQCGRRVPVVTGFFGPVPGSLLAQIGRGYTDLLAALAAVGTQARELQIWKEVDGIFTADPRKVPTAKVLSDIFPDEAAELTYYGSEVIHPFTMAQAIRKCIPIRIKNVERTGGDGTLVVEPDPKAPEGHVPDSQSGNDPSSSSTSGQNESTTVTTLRRPTAVTIKEHIMILNIQSNRKTQSHGFLARVFDSLDRYGVVVDLISTSEVHVSLAIAAEPDKGIKGEIRLGNNPETVIPPGTPHSVVKVVRKLHGKGMCTLSLHSGMVILSLVGRRMHDNVGVAGHMFETLARNGVNVEMISQGASQINISCVIKDTRVLDMSR